MGKRKKGNPGALSDEIREQILMVIARRAAAGDTAAAQIYLQEFNRLHSAGNTEALEKLDKLIAEIDILAETD